jgi:hypothetical protein
MSEKCPSGGIGRRSSKGRKQRSGARLHPDRLVVEGPIEQVRVAGLFEQIRRDVGFERARAHPTCGPHDEVFFDDLGAFLDSFQRSADSDADAAVQKNRRGQFQLVQNFEPAPIPDPVAVVAPGEIARRLLAAQKLLHAEDSEWRRIQKRVQAILGRREVRAGHQRFATVDILNVLTVAEKEAVEGMTGN